MSRSPAISDMYSAVEWEAVLGFTKDRNFAYFTSQKSPKAQSPNHRVLHEPGILWSEVTSEFLDQAFIYTYCVTSSLWKIVLFNKKSYFTYATSHHLVFYLQLLEL